MEFTTHTNRSRKFFSCIHCILVISIFDTLKAIGNIRNKKWMLNSALDELGTEALCFGLACDYITCRSDSDCPDTHVCEGVNRDFFGNARGPLRGGAGGILGGGGLGLEHIIGSAHLNSGGLIGGLPAFFAGFNAALMDSMFMPALGVQWAIRATARYCIPYSLQRPQNVISVGAEATNPLVHQLPYIGIVPQTPTMLLIQRDPPNYSYPMEMSGNYSMSPRNVIWKRGQPLDAVTESNITFRVGQGETNRDEDKEDKLNPYQTTAELVSIRENVKVPNTEVHMFDRDDNQSTQSRSDIEGDADPSFVWESENSFLKQNRMAEETKKRFINHQGRFVRLVRAREPKLTNVSADNASESKIQKGEASQKNVLAISSDTYDLMEGDKNTIEGVFPKMEIEFEQDELSGTFDAYAYNENSDDGVLEQARHLNQGETSEEDKTPVTDALKSVSPEFFHFPMPLTPASASAVVPMLLSPGIQSLPSTCRNRVVGAMTNYKKSIDECFQQATDMVDTFTSVHQALRGRKYTEQFGRNPQFSIEGGGSQQRYGSNTSLDDLNSLLQFNLNDIIQQQQEAPNASPSLSTLQTLSQQIEELRDQMNRIEQSSWSRMQMNNSNQYSTYNQPTVQYPFLAQGNESSLRTPATNRPPPMCIVNVLASLKKMKIEIARCAVSGPLDELQSLLQTSTAGYPTTFLEGWRNIEELYDGELPEVYGGQIMPEGLDGAILSVETSDSTDNMVFN